MGENSPGNATKQIVSPRRQWRTPCARNAVRWDAIQGTTLAINSANTPTAFLLSYEFFLFYKQSCL